MEDMAWCSNLSARILSGLPNCADECITTCHEYTSTEDPRCLWLVGMMQPLSCDRGQTLEHVLHHQAFRLAHMMLSLPWHWVYRWRFK